MGIKEKKGMIQGTTKGRKRLNEKNRGTIKVLKGEEAENEI